MTATEAHQTQDATEREEPREVDRRGPSPATSLTVRVSEANVAAHRSSAHSTRTATTSTIAMAIESMKPTSSPTRGRAASGRGGRGGWSALAGRGARRLAPAPATRLRPVDEDAGRPGLGRIRLRARHPVTLTPRPTARGGSRTVGRRPPTPAGCNAGSVRPPRPRLSSTSVATAALNPASSGPAGTGSARQRVTRPLRRPRRPRRPRRRRPRPRARHDHGVTPSGRPISATPMVSRPVGADLRRPACG